MLTDEARRHLQALDDHANALRRQLDLLDEQAVAERDAPVALLQSLGADVLQLQDGDVIMVRFANALSARERDELATFWRGVTEFVAGASGVQVAWAIQAGGEVAIQLPVADAAPKPRRTRARGVPQAKRGG